MFNARGPHAHRFHRILCWTTSLRHSSRGHDGAHAMMARPWAMVNGPWAGHGLPSMAHGPMGHDPWAILCFLQVLASLAHPPDPEDPVDPLQNSWKPPNGRQYHELGAFPRKMGVPVEPTPQENAREISDSEPTLQQSKGK